MLAHHQGRAVSRHIPLFLSVAPCLLAAHSVSADPAQDAASDKDEIIDYVIVTGSQVMLPPDYAGGQVARGGRVGLFGNLDIMDTPFNSTNYTAEFMRNLQAHSVADVVQSDPGVRVARGFGNFQELYVVRGFPVYSDDMGYNGLYGLLPRQYVAAEFLERVEVFRGANSFLNGAAPGGSGIGGSFNLVPKRAPDRALNRVTVGAESGVEGYGALDFARRFNDGDIGVRANAVRRDGETSVDDQKRELTMVSLGMDYRSDHARLSADFGYQDHSIDAPRPSVTPFGGIPREPDSSENFAQNWTFSSEKDFFGVARGEYDFAAGVSAWLAAGFRDSEEHNNLANPTAAPGGAATTYRFENYREDLVKTGDAGIRFEVETGPVGHRVVASVSYFDLDSKNAFALSPFGGLAFDLYDPVQLAQPTADFFVGGVLFSPRTTTKTKTQSLALADTLSFSEGRVLVTLGARYQSIEQNSYDYNDGSEVSAYDEATVTPVVGVVVKPWERISLYANYIEGLLQGEEVPEVIGGVAIANANEIFDPFKSKQYEVGAKYDGGTLGGSVAIFRINQPSSLLVGNVVTQDGEQRNQGIELSVYGQLSTAVRLLGGATLLDAEYRRASEPANDGKDVIGVPDTQANLGIEWDLTSGLSVDGRVVYTISQPASADNTLEISSWTRLDVGARYALKWDRREVTVRARVDNVTDENYWASVGGSFGANYLVLGGPRTFVISASFDF
ncbi:TonB-dependent receptor [Steroidobacter agaridevorans]|uniref:TonB-dependent receptor n=1 Tax=Steroidobacter agaridevorans TaxID=2695856 RepID=UPI00132BF61A|nr:TonB-dependent receptor [Steroidobacter agaridevorans]GFE88273.1 TonB-dependent receptor [Steroidobacter agaridevorans]